MCLFETSCDDAKCCRKERHDMNNRIQCDGYALLTATSCDSRRDANCISWHYLRIDRRDFFILLPDEREIYSTESSQIKILSKYSWKIHLKSISEISTLFILYTSTRARTFVQ